MVYDCFISYSRKDLNLTDRIIEMMTSNEVNCWIDRNDSVAGLDYAASIVRAIKNSRVFILIISKSSINSRHVLNELNTAVSADRIIIPINIDQSPLSDAMEYYLGKTQWIDADPNSQDWYNRLLESVRIALHTDDNTSDSLSETKKSQGTKIERSEAPATREKRGDKRACRILRYQDLLDIGYTSKTITIKLVENEYICYNDISDENEGTPEQWETFVRDESDTHRFLVNGENEIVGDWGITALTDDSQKRALIGDLLESEFGISTTVKICLPGVYHGYIIAINVLPEYRTQKNYLLLLNSLFSQVEDYAETGVFFDGWCMNLFSTEMESLMLTLGFKHVADNKETGKIYYLPFIPFPNHSYLRSFEKLKNLYEDRT